MADLGITELLQSKQHLIRSNWNVSVPSLCPDVVPEGLWVGQAEASTSRVSYAHCCFLTTEN